MKQLVFFCMLLFLGFTSTFAQTSTYPEGPPIPPSDQYVKYIEVDVSIQWNNDGIGHAKMLTLPFSLMIKPLLMYCFLRLLIIHITIKP